MFSDHAWEDYLSWQEHDPKFPKRVTTATRANAGMMHWARPLGRPCRPDEYYTLPPERRVIRAQLDRYVQSKLYWVLHAPRQTGKTTFLMSWMNAINGGGEAVACYVSVERCQEFPLAEEAILAICEAIRQYANIFLGAERTPAIPDTSPASLLSTILSDWSALVAPKPLVVLFDEVDVLRDQALVSFLRQLRGGFPTRGVGSSRSAWP